MGGGRRTSATVVRHISIVKQSCIIVTRMNRPEGLIERAESLRVLRIRGRILARRRLWLLLIRLSRLLVVREDRRQDESLQHFTSILVPCYVKWSVVGERERRDRRLTLTTFPISSLKGIWSTGTPSGIQNGQVVPHSKMSSRTPKY